MLLLALVMPSLADTLVVDASGSGGYTTIQGAIDAAASGDVIQIRAGTYAEALDTAGKDLSLVGADAASTILTTSGAGYGLSVTAGESVGVQDLTISGNQIGVYVVGSGLDLSGVLFSGNGTGAFSGGDLYLEASLGSVSGCSFDGGWADAGGAIYATGSTLSVDASTFVDAIAFSNGGAIYASGTDLVVTDSSFEGVETDGWGGAIYAADCDSLSVSGTQFASSSANYGGAIAAYNVSGVEIEGSGFDGGLSYGDGGAVYLDMADSAFVTGNVFTTNESLGSGGSVYVQFVSSALVIGNVLAASTAAGDGGGLLAEIWDVSGALVVQANIFAENGADGYGGALYAQAVDLDVVNNSMVCNAASLGGGVYQVSENGVFNSNIVAFNLGGRGHYLGGGASTSTYNNLYGNADGDWYPTDLSGSDGNISLDPAFVSLACDGSWNDDLTLSTGSPSIDAGDPGLDPDPDGSVADQGAYGGGYTAYLDLDGDGDAWVDDCNDADASVGPSAAEVWYDGVDSDCDGASDYDADGDGHDAEAHGGDDCDDTDTGVSPSADETWYDGFDSDCDGATDYDADLDGYEASAWGGEDCDDTDASAFPGGTEIWYDGVDQDCDGNDDDADGDGSDYVDDCDDSDAAVYPNADEVWYDGLDQDCDGNDDDADEDGFAGEVAGGRDCDDTNEAVNPDASEVWYDGIDDDCDGNDDDSDSDGFGIGDDCDDTDPSINPDAEEDWDNGIDENCDGNIDDADGDGFGGADDCDDSDAAVNPDATEVWYDGVDDDCDGNYDDADGDGFAGGAGGSDCDDANAAISPNAAEIWYDGVDSDCDGASDDDADYDGVTVDSDCDDSDANVGVCLTRVDGGGGASCNTAGGLPGLLPALIALMGLVRRRSWAALLLVPGSAWAVDATGPTLSHAGPGTLLATPGAAVGEVGRLDAAAVFHRADVTAQGTYSDGTTEDIVAGLNTIDLSLGLTPARKSRIELFLPLHMADTGGGLLGDVKLALQGEIYRSDPYATVVTTIAPRAVMHLPTGDAEALLGVDSPGADVLGVVSFTDEKRWLLNVAGGASLFAVSDLGGVEHGSGVVLRGGGGYFITESVFAGAEVVTRQGLGSPLGSGSADQPTEALAHVAAELGPVQLVVGAGKGLVDGVGAPGLRWAVGLRTSMAGVVKDLHAAPPAEGPGEAATGAATEAPAESE